MFCPVQKLMCLAATSRTADFPTMCFSTPFLKSKRERSQGLSSQLHICASQMDSGWRFLHLDLLLRSGDKPGALQKRSTVWQKTIQHTRMSLSLDKLFCGANVNSFPAWLYHRKLLQQHRFSRLFVLSPKKNTEWSSFCDTECFFKQKANHLIIPC